MLIYNHTGKHFISRTDSSQIIVAYQYYIHYHVAILNVDSLN